MWIIFDNLLFYSINNTTYKIFIAIKWHPDGAEWPAPPRSFREGSVNILDHFLRQYTGNKYCLLMVQDENQSLKYNLSLIGLGDVKVDLAEFYLKLQEN
jgi:hypothetical protein